MRWFFCLILSRSGLNGEDYKTVVISFPGFLKEALRRMQGNRGSYVKPSGDKNFIAVGFSQRIASRIFLALAETIKLKLAKANHMVYGSLKRDGNELVIRRGTHPPPTSLCLPPLSA
jgi:hypothetical protein